MMMDAFALHHLAAAIGHQLQLKEGQEEEVITLLV